MEGKGDQEGGDGRPGGRERETRREGKGDQEGGDGRPGGGGKKWPWWAEIEAGRGRGRC